MSTILNKDMIITELVRGKLCQPFKQCKFNNSEENMCKLSFRVIFKNKSYYDKLDDYHLGVCLLKFEDEREIFAKFILGDLEI